MRNGLVLHTYLPVLRALQIERQALEGTVKRAGSTERVGPMRRESPGDPKSSRTRTGSTSSNSSGKKTSESKPKDPVFSAEEGYVKMFLRGRPVTMYMPKDQVESYNLEAKADLPAKKLKLDWVYGYRGRDCRSNLYLLPTGETVYFIASVIVLYNVEEQLQRHYTGHNDDVKCLAVHPDKITIATGQVAGTSPDGKQLCPHVRVWDSVSLNTLHVLGMGFFDRAVTCIAFSKSNGGSNLCAVDDSNDHVLSVWDWQKEERLAEVKCSNEAVFAADFHPTDTNIIVTCGKSHLYFWTLESGSLVKKQGLFEDAAQSAGFHSSGVVVAIGTQTGRWLVLDTETKDLVTVHTDGSEQLSVMRYSPGIPSACKQVVSVEATRDIEWASCTCTLGFQVFGE
ncbi:UNVERIFIED_CONTAM: hypothetical protein FKN15_018677 [Acipenser sinensis]